MTKQARRKMTMKMKRAFRNAVQARKKHQRAVVAYKKLVRRYRAA
jgi:hypothetical protein